MTIVTVSYDIIIVLSCSVLYFDVQYTDHLTFMQDWKTLVFRNFFLGF